MQIRYLPALVMLIAGAIGCGFGIFKSFDLLYLMKMELVIMIVFFFIGKIAAKLITSVMNWNDESQSGIVPPPSENEAEKEDI